MTLTWRGLGFLGFLMPMALYAIATFITPLSEPGHANTGRIMLLLSAGIVWFLGKHLNGDANAEDARHLCMGMRLQNAAVISLGFLGLSFL